MNLDSLLDIFESFAIGLAIVGGVIALLLIVFFANDVIVPIVPELLTRAFHALVLLAMIAAAILFIYVIGRIARKPLKNKIKGKFASDESSYCEKCGSKLKGNAKFCDSCGTRIDR